MLSPPVGRCKIQLEGALAVFCACSGLMIELRGLYVPWEDHPTHGHVQHATMYTIFGLMGLVGLLQEKLRRHLPDVEGVLYLIMSMCFGCTGLLFYFHLHDRNAVDTSLHCLLIGVFILIAVTCLIELAWRSVISVVCRSILTTLGGTWFWQVGDILHGSKAESWLEDEHSSVMLISCIFVWHIAALIIVFILLAVCIAVCYKKHDGLPTSTAMYDKLLDKSEEGCEDTWQ